MWRARDWARDWYWGGQTKRFHMIPSLMDQLKEVDPGCVVDWNTMDDGHTFEQSCICPYATRGMLKYCQLVVCLDACHTKNCKYPTQLFLATVHDGDLRIVILCYAMTPSIENLENWTWFLSDDEGGHS